MSILNYAVGELRPQQKEALLWLEANWKSNDVFVLNMPVASGKSWVAVTLAKWLASQDKTTAIITPTKILQDQYASEFKNIPCLKGMENYLCVEEESFTCGEVHDILKESFCDNCPFEKLRTKARTSPIAILNNYTYYFNKLWKDTLILDEGHNTTSFLTGLFELKLWKSQYKWTKSKIKTISDIAIFIETHLEGLQKLQPTQREELIKHARKITRLQLVLSSIRLNKLDYHFHIETSTYRGKSEECLVIRPLTCKNLSGSFWGSSKKLVFLSATISAVDIKNLGLHTRKWSEFHCGSPIPVENRPINICPLKSIGSINYKNMESILPLLAKQIQSITEKHKDTKGLIHMTYSMAEQMKSLLTDQRYMWHTKLDKETKYQEFRQATEPKVFIASGMDEGIDLAYDAGRWQIITKIMYPNLSDPFIKSLKERSLEEYLWLTIRTVMQQTGRICRTPTDTGITYCLDGAFLPLYYQNKEKFASWFRQALLM